ncbi:MAG: hypothetical protein KJ606_01485 [Chloroflexi bacterium]|nr:hypothetical protein [Chloroflexota bacterium]
MRRLLLLIAVLSGLVVACSERTGTPTSSQPAFRVIAYITEAIVVEVIPFDKLTHINYAFLIPNADGTFARLANSWKLKKIVTQAHDNGVKVFISVGGWGWDKEFEVLAADPQARARCVQGLVDLLAEYNLDGVDMDWEYPDPGQSSRNFLALMSELRAALPSDKLLTAAVIAYGDEYGQGVPDEAFALMDFVNIMTYDGTDHGSMEQFQKGLDYWLGRGLAPEKIVLGVPFYARPNGTPYWKIVKADPAAAQTDTSHYFGIDLTYNGIPTIEVKTRLALERAGGIMFWTLEHDSRDEYSLLLAIHNIVVETTSGAVP